MITLPDTTAWIDCGEQRHRLHWHAGALTATDHPDAERERALAALGGERHRCLRLLDAWQEHVADPDVLLLGPRRPGDTVAAPDGDVPVRMVGRRPRSARARSFGWYAYNQHDHDEPDAPVSLDDLLRLPGGLPLRLTAQVLAAQDDGPRLRAALYGRFTAELRAWLGDPAVPVDLTVGADAALAWDGAHVRATLPVQWLADVWLPGHAVLLDRFAVGAVAGSGRTVVTTVGRELGEPSTVTVTSG